MTLLIDPPLLVAASATLERLVPDETLCHRLQAALTAATLGMGVAFYRNAAWTRPLWPLLHIESGRDWMLNTWVFRLDHRHASPALHVAVAAAFAAYPAWTLLGRRIARRADEE